MKTLNYLLIVGVVITMSIVCAWADINNDKSDKFSNDQSYVFSAGYINNTMLKTREVINQANQPKSSIENAAERVKDGLANNVSEDNANEAKLDLKHKTDAKGEVRGQSSTTSSTDVVLTATAKVSDELLAEAKEKGLISTTLNNGNIVNVWMEGDNAYFDIKDSKGVTLSDKKLFNTEADLNKSYVSKIEDIGKGKFYVIVTSYNYSTDSEESRFDSTQSLQAYNSQGVMEREEQHKSYDYVDLKTGNSVSSYDLVKDVYSADLNKDGFVDILDYGIWQRQFQRTTRPGEAFLSADINRDGMVFTDDYTYIQADFMKNGVVALRSAISTDSFVPIGSPTFSLIQQQKTGDILQDNSSNVLTYDKLFKTSERLRTINDSGNMLLAYNSKRGLESSGSAKVGTMLDGSDKHDIFNGVIASRDALAMQSVFLNENGEKIDASAMLNMALDAPTEDQKLILDTMMSLINDINKQDEKSQSPEVKKAADDLLQVVASILIAQAIPDLLKEGDVAKIKSVFAELNISKSKIMSDYQESVKPYYDEMKKIISKNIAILQLNNIVSKTMVEKELKPSEVDEILKKLRDASNKSFEEEYILQQEAKYRESYIEPNKKILEEKMKAMMKDFTQRLSLVLENTKSAKK